MEQSEPFRHRKNAVETAWHYLDDLTDHEVESMSFISERLLADGPLASCTVIIPVAAKQEAHNILRSMSCYARQETEEPFTVVLGLNADVPASDESVQSTLQAIETAKNTYPNLDVRSVYTEYLGEPTIGDIRRDLWNGVLYAGLIGGTITDEQDIHGINHDVDTLHLPKRYIKRIQDFAKDKLRSIAPTYTEVRHANDPRTPNVSRFTFWADFLYRNYSGGVGYEAGAVIPMSYYAENGGIKSNTPTHEIGSFLQKGVRRRIWKTGFVQTSPRRYQARLEAFGPDKIWTTDSFTPDDMCRDSEFAPSDISEQALREKVLEMNHLIPGVIMNANRLLTLYAPNGQNDTMTHAEYVANFERFMQRRKQIARRTLAFCVDVPDLVPEVIERQCDDQLLRERATTYANDMTMFSELMASLVDKNERQLSL